MKTKSLLLAFAGLGLFACSNEDLNESSINGEATVGVKISGVETRAEGEQQAVEINKIVLTLSASSATEPLTQTFTDDADGEDPKTALEKANAFKWTAVRNPRSMTVSINDGKAKYTIDEVKATGYAAPLYGTTTAYTTSDDGGTKLYTYTLPLKPTVARVEFSGISHSTKEHGELGCYFSQINWNGVFLNNYYNASDAESVTKHSAWSADLPLSAKIEGSFLAPWSSSDTYAWNIFPGLPSLTFSFKDIKLAEGIIGGDVFEGGNGYATVTGYKTNDGTPITEFEAGKIYKITNIEIEDSYIGGTVDPNKPVNVKAVVTVENWGIVNGTVTWN